MALCTSRDSRLQRSGGTCQSASDRGVDHSRACDVCGTVDESTGTHRIVPVHFEMFRVAFSRAPEPPLLVLRATGFRSIHDRRCQDGDEAHGAGRDAAHSRMSRASGVLEPRREGQLPLGPTGWRLVPRPLSIASSQRSYRMVGQALTSGWFFGIIFGIIAVGFVTNAVRPDWRLG